MFDKSSFFQHGKEKLCLIFFPPPSILPIDHNLERVDFWTDRAMPMHDGICMLSTLTSTVFSSERADAVYYKPCNNNPINIHHRDCFSQGRERGRVHMHLIYSRALERAIT